MRREDTADYRSIFLSDTPLLDTRAPIEFARGAFPHTENIPLLSDAERHEVGICYKNEGQQAAIALGNQLVAGENRRERLERWCQFARENPDGYLYCFRGGLRSRTVQQWMGEAGVHYPLVQGGYKAMRRYLLESFEAILSQRDLLLVAGKTGTGKTRVIDAVHGAIDLEGIARHRGSSFGRLLDPQPSQIDFENTLAVALLKTTAVSSQAILLEDEGGLIGRISLPDVLRERMRGAPLLVIEEPVGSRVQVIFDDYITDLGQRYRDRFGFGGASGHQRHLQEGLARIRKRLGGVLHQEVNELVEAAFSATSTEAADSLHRRWIELLLVKYYDPMYDYQFSKREGEIVATGTRAQIIRTAQDALKP